MGQALAGSQQPQEGPNNPEVSWWCKLLAKAIGTIAGVICLLTGFWTFVGFSARCIIAAILQLTGAGLVLMFEAPICCAYLDITKPVATFAEARTFFQKAIIYAVIAILPFALCFGLSTIIGCGPVFAAGVFYGLMALGKKADREQMLNNAGGGQQAAMPVPPATADDSKINLMEGEQTAGRDNQWGEQYGGSGYGGQQPQQQGGYGRLGGY